MRLVREGYAVPPVGSRIRFESLIEISLQLTGTGVTRGRMEQRTIEELEYLVAAPDRLELTIIQKHETRVLSFGDDPPAEETDSHPLEGARLTARAVNQGDGTLPPWVYKLADGQVPTAAQAVALRSMPQPFADDLIFPEEPSRPGDTWAIAYDLATAGGPPQTLSLTFRETTRPSPEEQEQARLTVESEARWDLEIEDEPLTATTRLEGTLDRSLQNLTDTRWNLSGPFTLSGELKDGEIILHGTGTLKLTSQRYAD